MVGRDSEAGNGLDPSLRFDCNYIEFGIDYKIAAGTDRDRLAKSTPRLLKEGWGKGTEEVEKFERNHNAELRKETKEKVC